VKGPLEAAASSRTAMMARVRGLSAGLITSALAASSASASASTRSRSAPAWR